MVVPGGRWSSHNWSDLNMHEYRLRSARALLPCQDSVAHRTSACTCALLQCEDSRARVLVLVLVPY